MFTIGLFILLCKDNVVVLIDSHMGGLIGSVSR